MSQKYRPYFTLNELKLIRECVQSRSIGATGLIRYLDSYIIGIESGVRQANHTLQPTLEQKLELTDSSSSVPEKSVRFQSAELWNQWKNNIPLTMPQIQAALTYGYEHDLMTPEQEQEFEASIGVPK